MMPSPARQPSPVTFTHPRIAKQHPLVMLLRLCARSFWRPAPARTRISITLS